MTKCEQVIVAARYYTREIAHAPLLTSSIGLILRNRLQ